MDIIDETIKNLTEGNDNVELLDSIEPGTEVRIYNRRNTGRANFTKYYYRGKKANYYGKGEDEYIFSDTDGDYSYYRTSTLREMPKNSVRIPKYNVKPRIRYNDAIDLKCSKCNTLTRFYYVDINPYIDFASEKFKYPSEIKCPVCGTPNKDDFSEPNLYLDKLHYGLKSPNGEKYEILEKGGNDNE